ncbi:MAG: DUF268 domain-containing protein [Chitinivibrionia bacterium]|nr:DUF268 domain-containing protein [Chitinivibrionia bacterium]
MIRKIRSFFKKKICPPRNIPVELESEFTMNGRIPVIDYYFDGTVSNPVKITQQAYKDVFSQLDGKLFKYYGDDVWAFYDAFTDYSLENKTVLIFGLTDPNCEAMAIWKNAKKVYVVDYNKPICEHEKIEVLTHNELIKTGLKFDIGISFSSFEHDGLGRYGDPISPNGDLKAMQYTKSLIKEDGLLFLGVPNGKDCLTWNAHRIYGALRFPILIKGYLCLDVYHIKSAEIFDGELGTYVQPLVVLKNVSEIKEQDFTSRINHAKELQKQEKTGTRDGVLLEIVLQMQIAEEQKGSFFNE